MNTGLCGKRQSGAGSAALLDLELLSVHQGSFTLSLERLELLPGARLGIVGRNGCGKTTLLESVIGMRDTTCMRGHLFGVALPAAIRQPALRRRMGCQLQSTRFSRHVTVNELLDLHLALYGRGSERLMSVLQINELRGLRGGLLSRGQRQRMELYMALAHSPDIVVLDEPMTGLDRRFCEALLRFVNEDLSPETVLMVVGHKEEELSLVNEIAWLQDGALLDRGTGAALVSRHAGAELVCLRFHRMERLVQARSVLSEIAGLRCWQHLDDLQLTLCGEGDIVQRVLASCPTQDVRSWEHTRTSVTDLVRLGSRPVVLAHEQERAPCMV
ncbi:ATP-binding cassette domain-containing protein [Xanthomonas hydrangeae]|uniref:ATP-binding cassette domain-containing protein n=1 Tax=Xanthomonas hydrangeae TaxID=2775159 RepID=A0AAU0B4S8_9XANT|nr:ATP-binding cassette domain-containing protein [Xanthomonas hydrangeae]WOB47931.1 ATP-binding cassette domain-containing protein [Xanthomonas hydrangeae]